MNMLDLMNKMTQLSEAKEKTKTGLKHTAEPGGYGRKDDEDDEGHKVKATAVKKGKGRPKKDADDSGETKKYDFSAFGVKSGKDVKLPKHDKKKTTVVKGKSQSHADNKKDDGTGDEEPKTKAKKKSLKEYFDALDQAMLAENEMSPDAIAKMNSQHKEYFGKNPHFTRGAEVKSVGKTINAKGNPISALATKVTPKFNKPNPVQRLSRGSFNSPVEEAEQIQIKPASQMPKQPGQMTPPGQQQQVAGQPAQNTQVIAQGNKTLGTVNNPQLAQQIKQSIGKGEMTLMPDQMQEEDMGKHNNATTGFDALVRKLTPKYGKEAATKIAGAQMKKIKEADQPPNDSLMSPIGEAKKTKKPDANKNGIPDYAEDGKGKNDLKKKKVEEAMNSESKTDKKKCPPMSHIKKMCKDGKTVAEICKMHPDCDQKELKQMIADCKKKMVKEGMEHKLKAARHVGKAHALSKQGYNCNYDDMEESRHYHEGFKEGLDECYGQMPIQGYVGETNPVVNTMASYGAHTPDLEEMDKTSYMKQQAIKTPGDTFKAFGQTFKDKEVVESPFFEVWEKELNSILEGKEVTEGVTISSSTGQQGSPNTVSINATDADADSVLNMIKQLGLGGLGGQEQMATGSQAMSIAPTDGGEMPAEIEVVDDHDDMLSLMRKMSGQGPAQASGDYEEEGGEEHGHEEGEEACGTCGASPCDCDGEEAVDENETMDQREYEVAEAEEVVNNNDEAEEEQTDATRDASLATAAGQNFADTDAPIKEGGDGGEAGTDAIAADDAADEVNAEEEDLDESYANGDDDTFETDIDFMTKVISGGLNKQKSTGQTTIPVVSTQVNRLGNPMRESTDLLTDWRKLSGIK